LWRREQIRERYDLILREIYEKTIKGVDWGARAEQIGKQVAAAALVVGPNLAKEYEPRINEGRDHIRNRMRGVAEQLTRGDLLKTLNNPGGVDLSGMAWTPQTENSEAAEMDADKHPSLSLKATGDGVGSWRLQIAVPPGTYRFEAKVKTAGVRKLQNPSGDGAGLRISGASRQGKNSMEGDGNWKKVEYEFQSGGGSVTLVAELRAGAGQMWIERRSLHLLRLR